MDLLCLKTLNKSVKIILQLYIIAVSNIDGSTPSLIQAEALSPTVTLACDLLVSLNVLTC